MKNIRPKQRMIIGLAIPLIVWASQSPWPLPPCGEQLNSAVYKGVIAKSNGEDMGTSNSCGGRGTYGLQYQCVEYIKRFYGDALGVDSKTWRGNAIDYFNSAKEYGFVSYKNEESAITPLANDLLVFSSDKSVYGHVAIITGTTSGIVSIIEQNWSSTGTANLALSEENGFYRIASRGSYSILGWLRRAWLVFVEGNPGGPGDGNIINSAGGELPFAFEPLDPIPLSQFIDGFTITAFLPPGTQDLADVSFSIITEQPEPCFAHFGVAGGPLAGTVVVNGVEGKFWNVSQATIQGWLYWANSNEPNCNLQLNDIYIGKVYLYTQAGENISVLDAMSVLPGQNKVPLLRK